MSGTGELALAFNNGAYEEARSVAEELSASQLHAAAREAGLQKWLRSANPYAMSNVADNVAQALRMPYPSPFVQSLREKEGYTEGVQTRNNGWTLDISSSLDRSEPYDTGVVLVASQKSADKSLLRVPLDVVIPTYSFTESLARPDRIQLKVGDRQLPSPNYFREEVAQGFLLMAARFVDIVAKGEIAQTTQLDGRRRWWGRLALGS